MNTVVERRPDATDMRPAVPGLRYVSEFLDLATHDRVLRVVDMHPWQQAGGRGVQVYGHSYCHAKGAVYRLGDLASWAAELAERLHGDGLMPSLADQVIANDYPPGAGIFAHVDAAIFDDTIVSVSLGSACAMQFTESITARQEEVRLEPRSALVLSGDARHNWTHAVPARLSDVWAGREAARGRRVSLTFRTMLQTSGPLAV